MKPSSVFFTICTLFLLFCLLFFPQPLLQKAIESVDLWFHLVLPSLFPFLTATGILIRLGMAQKLGRILQPVMQPVFGLSGICAFPLLLGILSGYPSGAKITVTLCQQNALSKKEAQRILAFCNNPGPLFVVGTAGTAFLKNPALGYIMLFSIFLGAILTGIVFRFFYKQPKNTLSAHCLRPALSKEPIGKILGGSVADAMETVLQIGGFVILFGVIIEALNQTGIFSFLTHCIGMVLPFSSTAIEGILGGFLEMTNGASLLSQSQESIRIQITCITAVLSFGGLSILAQTLGILAPISISTPKYIFSKCVNSVFSAFICFFCYPFLAQKLQKAVSVGLFPTKTALSADLFSFLCSLFLSFALLSMVFFHKE